VTVHPGERVRPVSWRATAAALTLAVAAVLDLIWAFTPLASLWAAREAAGRGGRTPGVVLIISNLGALAMMTLAHLLAGAFLAAWIHRAAANARVLGWSRWSPGLAAGAWFIPLANWVLPPIFVAGVARASRLRHSGRLVWCWWLTWAIGSAVLGLGTVVTFPTELADLTSQVIDGATVDLGRLGELLGYQIAARLPGAVLLIAAAVLGIMAVDGVTTAQYDRFEELGDSAGALPVVPAQRLPLDAESIHPGSVDAGAGDTGSVDAGSVDAGSVDADAVEIGPAAARVPDRAPTT
jgi:hypothetical protein